MKQKFKLFLPFIFMLCYGVAYAQDNPITMLEQASNQMIHSLEKNKSRLNETVVDRIVRQVLLPKCDVNAMARSVVGRNYWMRSTAKQRRDFVRLFASQVIKTYGAALESYDGDRVRFYPVRGGYDGGRVQVRSMIMRKNGQHIPVSYRLVKQGSTWRVYDFSVEGVSMVQSYRSQFAPVLANGGMQGLIAKLSTRSR